MGETQATTAERIEKQLNDIHDTYPGSVYDCFRVISTEIAAEIDSLTEQLAEARADVHDAGQRNDDMAATRSRSATCPRPCTIYWTDYTSSDTGNSFFNSAPMTSQFSRT